MAEIVRTNYYSQVRKTTISSLLLIRQRFKELSRACSDLYLSNIDNVFKKSCSNFRGSFLQFKRLRFPLIFKHTLIPMFLLDTMLQHVKHGASNT